MIFMLPTSVYRPGKNNLQILFFNILKNILSGYMETALNNKKSIVEDRIVIV